MNSVTPIWPAVFLGMYLFLELLDWGRSLAAPFVARNQEENKAVLSLLKPGIDLNEAWLIFGLSLVASEVPAAAGDTMHDSSWRCFPWPSWAARFASSRLSSKMCSDVR